MRIAPMEAEVLLEALGDAGCQLDHNGDCQEHGWFGINGKCPVAESRELIATALKIATPTQVEVTDELIESIARAEYVAAGLYWSKAGKYERAAALARTRRTVEAALPLLGPRPLLDREAVKRILGDVRALPVTQSVNPYIDAVLELARPMPTEAEIAAALSKCTCSSRPDDSGRWVKMPRPTCPYDGDEWARARAVLALLDGSKS